MPRGCVGCRGNDRLQCRNDLKAARWRRLEIELVALGLSRHGPDLRVLRLPRRRPGCICGPYLRENLALLNAAPADGDRAKLCLCGVENPNTIALRHP
jgi:hypothetical protein